MKTKLEKLIQQVINEAHRTNMAVCILSTSFTEEKFQHRAESWGFPQRDLQYVMDEYAKKLEADFDMHLAQNVAALKREEVPS